VPQLRSAAQFTALSGHTVQHTVTELLRVTFGQVLRHPHIVMLSRAFETCFRTSDSFYIEVIDPSYLFVITSTINKSQGQLLATTFTRNVRRRGGRLAKFFFCDKVSPVFSMSDWITSFQTLTRVSLLHSSDKVVDNRQ